MAEGLDANSYRSLEAANLFLARPGAATNSRRDDPACRSDFWVPILARFRSWNDFAYSDRRTGCDVAIEGNERRFYLHPRVIRCLDNCFASSNRREIPVPKRAISMFLLLPVYYLLVSAATWAAILDLALRPHYWAKTAHGRSRQGQSSLIRRTQLSV